MKIFKILGLRASLISMLTVSIILGGMELILLQFIGQFERKYKERGKI